MFEVIKISIKNIAVLGSTGSIGTQALDVVRSHSEELHISVIAANSNDELFEKQIEEFSPELAVLSNEAAYQSQDLSIRLPNWQVADRLLLIVQHLRALMLF